MNQIDGFLIADKPQEWTSHDVCAFVRKHFKIKKVGHAGTLDPIATGVLVLLLGRATKQSIPLSSCEKEYQGVMELGIKTDSHDRSGKVIGEAPWESVTLEDVRERAKDFTGEIIQVPPMVSALKHKGVRLYKLARQGKEVHRDGRSVTVREFNIVKKEGARVHFSATVSKGTYVRTLVHDLGDALGCFATLAALERIRSGTFHVKDSVKVDAMKKMSFDDLCGRMIPIHLSPVYSFSLES
ncbi:MAG: tRNA pseudouridine(55) synthase TruB [Candidatus Omnitrophota bacterium]|nr:tRNA pseudouridine(55) synthase TruB [Candidatus Omnitrophota bacterium]